MSSTGTSVTRLALRPDEAAAALGVSRDYLERHLAHELRWVRRGRLKLVPVADVQRWLDANAELVLDLDRSARFPERP